jgi:hypothetical protein
MERKEYLDNLREKYSAYFDVFIDYKVMDYPLTLYAKNHIRNEKYVATKGMTIWAYETNEHCLIIDKAMLIQADIDNFFTFLISSMKVLVNPHGEHKSTSITGVITTDNLSKDLQKVIKRKSHVKYFSLGLRGWCDVRLIVVDVNNNLVYGSKGTEKLLEHYYPENNKNKKPLG